MPDSHVGIRLTKQQILRHEYSVTNYRSDETGFSIRYFHYLMFFSGYGLLFKKYLYLCTPKFTNINSLKHVRNR